MAAAGAATNEGLSSISAFPARPFHTARVTPSSAKS
jgi:hypothetical protein